MRPAATLICSAALFAGALFAETKVKLESLPSALQAAIKDQAKGAVIKGISKETEKGKTLYEVETIMSGKSRDLMFEPSGKVVSVEEETTLDTLPAPAREAIQKKVGAGKITKVETVTEGSIVSYEAAYKAKTGKSAEFAVNADGSPHKN